MTLMHDMACRPIYNICAVQTMTFFYHPGCNTSLCTLTDLNHPLTCRYEADYSGTWCDIPGVNTNYLSASGSLSGLTGTGFIEVQAVVNNTMLCISFIEVSDVSITYQSVSLKVAIPPLGISKDASSKVAGKLNDKLPIAATKIQDRINAMASSKVPLCKAIQQ